MNFLVLMVQVLSLIFTSWPVLGDCCPAAKRGRVRACLSCYMLCGRKNDGV